MAWRTIATEDGVWHVRVAAERHAYKKTWQLMLSFRSVDPGSSDRSFWAPYPMEASSKSSLFVQAEKIPDAELHKMLVEHVG
jgi:hypothetical protein